LPLGWLAGLPFGRLAWECEECVDGLSAWRLARWPGGFVPGWDTPEQYAITLAAPPAADARLRKATAFSAALPCAFLCAYAVHSPYAA
jgi:hypothetical protein